MKEFDLQMAKKGHPVCTRDGRRARIICFDRKDSFYYNIVACILDENGTEEDVETYTDQGIRLKGAPSKEDLFMATEKKEGWINIYLKSNGTLEGGVVHDSEHEALSVSQNVQGYITTVKIEWEE